jgi:hypothetical protein
MISCEAPGLAPVDQALATLLAGIAPNVLLWRM